MKKKIVVLILAGTLTLGMAAPVYPAASESQAGSEQAEGGAFSDREPEFYRTFSAEWFAGLSEDEVNSFIEGYFDRETVEALYESPYEVEVMEEELSIANLFGALSDTGAPAAAEEAKETGAAVALLDEPAAMPQSTGAVKAMTAGMPEFSTEEYNYYAENGFHTTLTDPLSTFAADVDTGSYGNLRRYIEDGYTLNEIPKGLLRYEEILNYFDYTVGTVSDGRFSLQTAAGWCPWNPEHELLQLTVSANEVEMEDRGSNFVFLMDVSGSMDWGDSIVLAAKSLAHLAATLDENDRVSVVTYSGSDETLLEGCQGTDIVAIFEAIRQAEANCMIWGGGTNGSGGITAAYECAEAHFIEGGNNRVLIASDGDMNLGVTSQAGLVDLITEKKESGVFLTTLGFGEGNYSDANMEQIADCGNGNYFYIDSVDEAIRVLVKKVKQTTVTVAKDVKLQVEFNPAEVEKYRLIGYENRTMSADDFSDDQKDGGETGAGSQVTVLYEIVPAAPMAGARDADVSSLKYQTDRMLSDAAASGEVATLSIRYKEPDGDTSTLEEYPVLHDAAETEEFLFTAALTEACMVINGSAEAGNAALSDALALMSEHIPEGDADRANCYAMLKMLDQTE